MRLFKKREDGEIAPIPRQDVALPQQPKEDGGKRIEGQWYLEHLSEDERLALQRTRYDEYYGEDGVQGEVGGAFGAKEFERIVKPFFMMLKHIRDLIGQMEDTDPWYKPEEMWAVYQEIRAKANALGYIEGREYLEIICSRFLKKSGLGLRGAYQAEHETSEDDFDAGDDGGETVSSEYPEEEQ